MIRLCGGELSGSPPPLARSTRFAAVYQQIAALHNPPEPSDQLLLAQAAQNAGDNQTAVEAYKKFV